MNVIKLFDYQEDMKERIEKALRLHRSVMAQMPTGTGKTYLLTAVIDSFVSNNPMEKVWIVAHRRELVSQIDETVRKFHSYSASNTSSLLSSVKAMSIQWLMRHYDEIEEEPGMIVIDEAHHALAKTYKEMWERFPKAKFLGLTATPCRLNGKGFTDLFDVLVQSWSVPEFISKGRLATYDFVSIKSDGVTQRLIDSLQKRGADGDYQNKEMDMLLNKKPSIERLYRSLEEFGKDRKGIVYAINISHANAIAEFYREHGIAAVAIDSKTPASERRMLIERFKASSLSFSKITPSLFTLKEGSTSHPDPLTLRGEGGNRPTRCSEPLRSKVGGPSKVSPDCAGWDRLGAACLRPAEGLGDHLGMSGASKVSPDCLSASAFNVPIKAVSIQWLSKHYDEIEEEPGMIVIDEAHHALAKTYKEMWERFPKAKFLGLTATPCRLNGKGFTDLFDVLVQSWSVPEFISKGRLATYDFVSIKSDGVTQRLIDSLQKRGADGDYQNKEMDMLLNKKPSIERLYRSLEEFGKDRKGIVYAINISHANAIAEFYREHGIAAVAIDSKTPASERRMLIERFKASSLSFSKITPSLFTLKEGSTSHPDPLSSGAREKTALLGARNRYVLRLVGHQSPRHLVRAGTAWGKLVCCVSYSCKLC